GEISRSPVIPPAAAVLLRSAASDTEATPEVCSLAARTLLRMERAEDLYLAFGTAVNLQEKYGRQPPFDELWKGLTQPNLAGPHVDWFAEASQVSSPTARLADGLLLSLLFNKETSPETKAKAQQALDAGWTKPTGRAQQLEAAELLNLRDFEPRVREAMHDVDPGVAAIAKKVAADWKLKVEPTPLGPAIKTLDKAKVLAAAVQRQGDIEQGKFLFNKIGCNKCHTVNKDEPLRGPYLPQVAKTYKRDQLAEAILDPSKTLAQGFVTQIFVLDDGTQLTGFVTEEDAQQVKIRDKDAKEFTIPVDRIEVRSKQQISMMPEGQLNDYTVGDLSSLLDYLQSVAD
ncbi:MAG: heme-binding protein, partial [Planctomycetaceae bacterium]